MDNNPVMCEFFQTHTLASNASASAIAAPHRPRPGTLLMVVALLLCLLQISAAVFAGEDYEAAQAAYQQGDFGEAERIWRQLAEQGEVRSQFFLGVLYDQGPEPLGKNDTEASRWFEKAASQGHVNAQFNLGNAYMNGRGVAQSHERAVYWWRQAADNGSPNAQFNLAIQYYQGRGVDKDWDKAVVYFNRAADNGHAKAMELIASNQVPRLEESTGSDTHGEAVPVAGIEHTEAGQDTVKPEPVSGDVDAGSVAVPAMEPASTAASAADWLRGQDPRHYTVQLAVSGSEEGIDRLVSRHNLSNDAVRVAVLRDGKTLYYLLMGSFVERRQASLHIESLAADLRASKPWPRPFAELQALAGHDG